MTEPMNGEEKWYARIIYDAIQQSATGTERDQQTQDFRIGISDLGYCSEKVRRMVVGIPEPPVDKLAAFLGRAIGAEVEQALIDFLWPDAIRQADVSVKLVGDAGRTYTVTGHPDLVLPFGLMLDVKTARGLGIPRRKGPSQQQQFQRHCYGLGAWNAGLFDDDLPVQNVRVGNVWVDRSGDEHEVHVDIEPLDLDVVAAAGQWLDELAWAYTYGEVARKEPPREVCAVACGHFPTCRALDTDVQGLLTDDSIIAAVDQYREGIAMVRDGERLKDQSKSALTGVSGSTGNYSVRWVHVNAAEVNYIRDPYDRLDIRELK